MRAEKLRTCGSREFSLQPAAPPGQAPTTKATYPVHVENRGAEIRARIGSEDAASSQELTSGASKER